MLCSCFCLYFVVVSLALFCLLFVCCLMVFGWFGWGVGIVVLVNFVSVRCSVGLGFVCGAG